MPNLETLKNNYLDSRAKVKKRIIVCAGTGCIANGALKVFAALKNSIAMKGLDVCVELKSEADAASDVYLSGSGCQGFCQVGPLVTIEPEEIQDIHRNRILQQTGY